MTEPTMPKTPPIQRDAAKVELKPCAHCGCAAMLEDASFIPDEEPLWAAECTSTACGVRGPVRDTEAEASEAWNQRDLRPDDALRADLTRPLIGIENRTAQEVFDIMCDRFRAALNERNPKP